jgi:hypothetical protein
MDSYFYYSSIRRTTIQVLNVFNNVKVGKYDRHGELRREVPVPLKLMPKEKFYYWTYDKRHEKRLPMMAMNLTGMAYDEGRAVNLRERISTKVEAGIIEFFNPVPYNFSYQLYLTSMFVSEHDQMLEQILPFFDPYVMVTVGIPEIDANYDVKLILSDASPDMPTEIPEEDYRVINWTLSLEAQAYILKPVADVKLIEQIYGNLYEGDRSKFMESISLSGHKDADDRIIAKYEILTEEPEG